MVDLRLSPDFVFRPEITTPPEAMLAASASDLGPLALLPGAWVGRGFNTIWRPLFGVPNQGHFLELNLTVESLDIEEVQGKIPNRGALQPDIDMRGLHYLQQISDANTEEALHFEPGIWLTIPVTTEPHEPATVARLGSIPHGTSILAQGTAFVTEGPPVIEPVSITAFRPDSHEEKIFPEANLSIPTDFRSPPEALAGVTQEMVNDPNSVLRDAIAGQTITRTTTLVITTALTPVAGGGTANTAFLQGIPGNAANADAALATAIFWIEEVQGQDGAPDFLQLQYTQTVMLNFNGFTWPHVSVATLQLAAPDDTP